jgi:hypothetical protein
MNLKYRLPSRALVLTLIGVSCPAMLAAQPSSSLLDQITQRYTVTKVDPDGTVTRPGTVVSVGQHLLSANPIYGDRYQPNSYKKGRISQPLKFSRANLKLADSIDFITFNEKVYITNIEVNESAVIFSLQTCAPSLGRALPGAIYRAALSFQFPKGSVSLPNLKQIEDTIAEVLTAVAPDESSAGTVIQPQTTPTATEPPASSNGQGVSDIVHVGQTVEEVKALLGQPDKIEDAGGKLIYSYTGLRITFINGKVSDVQ